MKQTLTITPSNRDLPKGWEAADLKDHLYLAVQEWNRAGAECGAIPLEVSEPQALRWVGTRDVNLVVFRTQSWCRNERCGHGSTYPALTMAVTQVHASEERPTLKGGDIELNAVRFRFLKDQTLAEGMSQDNEAGHTELDIPMVPVLAHELGHVLGLRDRCIPAGESPLLHAPSGAHCDSNERESVMFAPALNRTLSELDVAQLCELYAAGSAEAMSANGSYSKVSESGLPDTVTISFLSLALACLLLLVFMPRTSRSL